MEGNNDDNFEFPKPKKSSKRNLSTIENFELKIVKPLFITLNRFSSLSHDDTEVEDLPNDSTLNDNLPPDEDQNAKKISTSNICSWNTGFC